MLTCKIATVVSSNTRSLANSSYRAYIARMNDIKVSNQEMIAVDRMPILNAYLIHHYHQDSYNFLVQYKIHTQY